MRVWGEGERDRLEALQMLPAEGGWGLGESETEKGKGWRLGDGVRWYHSSGFSEVRQ